VVFAVFWSSGFHWDKSCYDGQPCRLRSVRVGGWTDVAISLDVGTGWLATTLLQHVLLPSRTKTNYLLPPTAGNSLEGNLDLFRATLCFWLYSILVILDDHPHSNVYTRAAIHKHRIHSAVAVDRIPSSELAKNQVRAAGETQHCPRECCCLM
jgi:hypothetical protein